MEKNKTEGTALNGIFSEQARRRPYGWLLAFGMSAMSLNALPALDLDTRRKLEVGVWLLFNRRAPDPVQKPLDFLVDLLEEYIEHYGRSRGNPGKARGGEHGSLRPLEAFAEVLMPFWVEETGQPFGHVVERADVVEGFDPTTEIAPREALSPALDFLNHASLCLPDRYTVANLETMVRALKRQR